MSRILDGGFVSTDNSTIETLGAGATYTGTWEDITKYASISIIASADQNATLWADFSIDGATQDRNVQLSTGTDTALGIHSLIPIAQYFRVRCVDAGSGAAIRIQTMYHSDARIAQPTSRMSQSLGNYSDVLNTRAVNVGAIPDGTFQNVQADGLGFQTSSTLTNGQTYDSGVLSLEGYTQVQTHVLSDVVGTIVIDFIRDSGGTDILRTLTIPYGTDDLNIYQTFSAPAFTPYVRYRFTADAAGQADFYFDTKFLTKSLSGQLLGVDAFISPLMVANLGRNIIVGKTPGGTYSNVAITNQRALQITPPQEGKTAFGEALTGQLVDQTLIDYAFGNIEGIVVEKANQSGSVTNANQLGTVSTGAAANSSGQIETTERVRYVPGHGNRARFTAGFTTGVANSTQIAGIGDESNGFFFGYNGTSFGILHRKDGAPEIRTLTVTSGANDGTGTDDITITLDGNAKTVTLTDFTGDATITANEIAAADYSDTGRGWTATAYGSTVVFVSWDASVRTGTYSLVDTDATGAAGTFAQTVAGAAPTDTWVAQASWNGEEIFDGNGITGTTLDPTKINVFQIQYQYLGAGNIYFFIEDTNDGEFHLVHTIRFAGANTGTSLSNPHLPLTLIAENTSNTSDLSVSSASMAGMTDGFIELVGNRRALSANTGSVSAATPVIVIKNDPVFNGKRNTNKIKILSISTTSTIASGKSVVTIELRKNATIVGASYTQIDASNSFVSYDTSATSATGGTVLGIEESIVDVVSRFDSTDANDLIIDPGDTLTIVATPSNNNTTTYVSIRFVELL